MVKIKSVIGFSAGECPPCPKTPKPYVKAYRTGGLNLETIDPKSIRTKLATGRSRFSQNVRGGLLDCSVLHSPTLTRSAPVTS